MVWALTIVLALIPLTWSVIGTLLRGDVGVDAIALVAMAGALALGEYLAGAVIALMLAGGNALEAAAGRRARRELTALLERAPRIAHRRRGDGSRRFPWTSSRSATGSSCEPARSSRSTAWCRATGAVVDESALTGEPLPVSHAGAGTTVSSGTAERRRGLRPAGDAAASESAYAGIVRLVREAEQQRAPFVRMADRYAASSCRSRSSSPGPAGR